MSGPSRGIDSRVRTARMPWCASRPRSKQGYATTLVDLKNHKVFDVVPGRSEPSLRRCLSRLPGRGHVKVVVMDLSETYRQIVRKYFPNAQVVADLLKGLCFGASVSLAANVASVTAGSRLDKEIVGDSAEALKRLRTLSRDKSKMMHSAFSNIDRIKRLQPAVLGEALQLATKAIIVGLL